MMFNEILWTTVYYWWQLAPSFLSYSNKIILTNSVLWLFYLKPSSPTHIQLYLTIKTSDNTKRTLCTHVLNTEYLFQVFTITHRLWYSHILSDIVDPLLHWSCVILWICDKCLCATFFCQICWVNNRITVCYVPLVIRNYKKYRKIFYLRHELQLTLSFNHNNS